MFFRARAIRLGVGFDVGAPQITNRFVSREGRSRLARTEQEQGLH